MTRARGHLLAKWFGGPGHRIENLVPLHRAANQEMLSQERRIAEALTIGTYETVYYRVTPVYGGRSGVPVEVRMEAVGVTASGVEVQFMDYLVRNVNR